MQSDQIAAINYALRMQAPGSRMAVFLVNMSSCRRSMSVDARSLQPERLAATASDQEIQLNCGVS